MKIAVRIGLAIWLGFVLASHSRATTISWTQFQADSRHTGHIPAYVSPSQIAQLWSRTSAQLGVTGLVAGTVTDGQSVYLAGISGLSGNLRNYKVQALDPATGNPSWSQNVTAYIGNVSAPSVGDGTVYVHSWGHSSGALAEHPKVVGLNASTGAVTFATTHSGQWSSGSRPTVAGAQVFAAGGYYGGLDSYSASSGSNQWFAKVNQQYGWIPAADENNVYVYMGPASASPGPPIGTLYAFDRASGAQQFKIQDPSDRSSGNGTVYLGSQNDALAFEYNGVLASFDLLTRSVRWRATGGYTSSLAIDDDLLFVRSGTKVSVLRESDGVLLSSWTAPATITKNVVLTENLIFTGTNSMTYAIDRSTMQTVWSTNVSGDLTFGDNLLLISSTSGVTAYLAVPEPGGFTLATCALTAIAVRVIRRVPTKSSQLRGE